jgi:predicted signal transduction protein with EAL and GGDEF domain
MSHEIREGDFVARLGGDEFVVGVEDVTDESAVITLAHRLIAAISQPIRVGEDLTVQVGASVGIALGRGGETDVETLLHEADLAVYRAKAAGRGCAELFSWSARAALKERNELERALVGAIADDELVLHFQPIVNMQTGEVDCYEALVRWDRPGHGLLPPDDFLPVAESSDLICQLDTWVLRAAVAQLSRWNRMRGDRELKLAVNISGRHISQHRIQSDVAGALRVSTVDPRQLVVEVTETALMDGSVAATNLEALRTTGVTVSLDDFGTGYQSSAQLSRLPVDVVKIDRRFVDTSSPAARSLFELMVRSAHAFGAEVVAEGVECDEELAFAREIGCEYVQGFYVARPAPADQLQSLDRDDELAV